jgi:DNA-binding XRE family transcriptional regulator
MAKASTTPEPSALVPRLHLRGGGRKPPNYPTLNFQKLAPMIGVSPTWLGRILNGRFRPSLQVAARIAQVMGWTIEQVSALYKEKPEGEKADAKSRNGSTSNTGAGNAARGVHVAPSKRDRNRRVQSSGKTKATTRK